MKVSFMRCEGWWMWIDMKDECNTTYHIHLNKLHLCVGRQRDDQTSTYYYIGDHPEHVEFRVK